ncbi:MAG: hypothetical protein GX053_04150 [Tissierella sp.]|nr:hypothetical protein [Tissierella sp.]
MIKKNNVSTSGEDTSYIDTKLDYDKLDFVDSSGDSHDGTLETDEDTKDPEDELDEIRNQIRQDLLQEIQEQRDSIINEAMEEAEEIRLRARDTGYTEGFSQGSKDGKKQGLDEGTKKGLENGYLQGVIDAQDEANQIKKNALNMLNKAGDEVDKYMAENQGRIIDLAAQMAESIIHSTIDSSSENILQLIRPIIQQFRKVETVIITCNPHSYDYLKKSLYQIEKKYEDIKFVLFEDDGLEKNGCIIENENQIIDLQIGKQLKNIVEKIKNME